LLAVRTWYRNAEFADPLTLWQTVVERRPHGRARMAYGSELMAANRHGEALAQFRQAVGDFPNARAALATELLASGRTDEAIKEFRTFIEQDPALPNRLPARQFLVRALTLQGRLDEAAAELRTVLQALPNDAMAQQARTALGLEYRKRAEAALKASDAEGAIMAARQALALDARDAEAHNLLGAALATRGRMDEAIVEFQEAASLNPDDAQAANNLARARALRGNR
jgi:Flp pilus assembly protein TadD